MHKTVLGHQENSWSLNSVLSITIKLSKDSRKNSKGKSLKDLK